MTGKWRYIRIALIIFIALPQLSSAQEVEAGALIDSTLRTLPGVIALAEKSPEQIAGLRLTTAQSSFYITDTSWENNGFAYYNSGIVVPLAKETRIIAVNYFKPVQIKYYWSVIIEREYNKKSLAEGRVQELFQQLDSLIGKQYPGLRKSRDKRIIAGVPVPVNLYSKFVSPDRYEIGLEAWHEKIGNRNQLRLFVSSLK